MGNAWLLSNRFAISDPEQDLLGRGSMGEVYRATDTHTGEPVAVKVLDPRIVARDPGILERFAREGEALRQLDHPNIVRMVTAVEEEDATTGVVAHYLVMEYVAGGSLQDLLDTARPDRSLPVARVLEIALDLADALTRAHRLGIIHRDLKPANVLLAEDGTPRLTDFGIARVSEGPRLTQTGVLVGTPDFLSPEACDGKAIDERGDIWAFGVLLFEMLAGETPFPGDSLTTKLTAILTQPVPDLAQRCPSAPEALVDLICRMLEKDREQRIPSVRLVGAELEAIQKGRERPGPIVVRSPPSSGVPAFLAKGFDVEQPVFVTCESELAQLDRLLNHALAGRGQVAFITGDPGQGKTALAREFARHAREKHPDLATASGNCNAYTGIGDPYLPFREILELLCGDIESHWEARAISREHAIRLWQCLPLAVQALVESGRDLVDVFIAGDTLTRRLAALPAWHQRGKWLPKLEQLVQHKATMPADPSLQQAALFEQYSRVLQAIARQSPLLLTLDDLQWGDSGSINLLFHLGKRIVGSRILILGTYRPNEVALGRGGERHPLEPIVNEFKRQFGEAQIELGKGSGRRFVDAFVDSEPNRLGEEFRATLARVTRGHPLGTVELLRDMQERGGLEQDGEGRWVEGRELDWDVLPARVEAVIAERIERLDPTQRQALKVASVEGETFTAEVVAQVLGEEPQGILSLLSNELDRHHRLVSAQKIRLVDGRRLSIYRFQHILCQRYLHGSLDAVERSNLHQAVGAVLQDLYAEGRKEISGQLARHFQEAGTNVQAAGYQIQAGDRAVARYAYQEAVDHYQQSQAAFERALGNAWDPLERAGLEHKIGDALSRKGNLPQALEHLRKALLHLDWPLPTSRWGVRLAILAELLKQLWHRLTPGLLVKPGVRQVSPRLLLQIRTAVTIGWTEVFSNREGLLLVTLRTLNLSESSGMLEGIIQGSASFAVMLDYSGLFDLAGGYHKRAVKLAEESENPRNLAHAYMGMCLHQMCLGKLDAAHAYAVRSANTYRQAGDTRQKSFMEYVQAQSLLIHGRFAQALATSKKVVMQGYENLDPQIQCWGLTNQGDILRRSGDIPEAIKVLEEAVELGNTIPDYEDRIEAGGELGRCLVRLGQIENALSVLEETRRVYTEHGTTWGNDIALYNGLAEAALWIAEQDTMHRKANLSRANQACREALEHARKSRVRLPDAMRIRAACLWLNGDRKAAQKMWRQSLKLAQEQGQYYDEGVILLDMGSRLGDRSQLEKAITILSEVGAEWDLARAHEALGKLSDQA